MRKKLLLNGVNTFRTIGCFTQSLGNVDSDGLVCHLVTDNTSGDHVRIFASACVSLFASFCSCSGLNLLTILLFTQHCFDARNIAANPAVLS